MADSLAEQLKQIELFSGLRRSDIDAVADLAQRSRYSAGSVICRQGEMGERAYFVESGELRIRRIDPEGIEQEVARMGPGGFFGETSLLLGEPRDATVEATSDATLIYWEKDDFDRLLEERPRLLDALQMSREVRIKKEAPRFKWLAPDEVVVRSLHKHGVTLIGDLFPLFLMLSGVLAVFGQWYARSGSGLVLLVGLILAAIPVLFSIYLVIDHYNDDYILTNERVVHEEREFLIRESRAEAPLRNIQNIQQVREGLWARLFDLGDLIIETAGERGVVVFRRIPHPTAVQDAILDQVQRVQAIVRAEERVAVRDALRRRFSEESTEEGVEVPQESGTTEERRYPIHLPSWLLAPWRVFRYFVPSLWHEEGDTITWRKHWVALIRPLALPTGLILAVTFIAGVMLYGEEAQFRISPILLGYGVTMLFLFPWWLWNFEDWRNDIYQVTSSRIIDVEQMPFALREQRREASLGRIQNITLEIPSLWGHLLGYGSVTIETAGAGAFTFDRVRKPRKVQDEIFRRVEAFEDRQRQQEARRRRDELLDWFTVYDQLRGSPSSRTQSS